MMGNRILLIFCGIVMLGVLTNACEQDQMRNGCRIFNAQCSCGYGCKSEYRYESMESCKMALKGRRHDICTVKNPCLHGGSCLQITQEPLYKCQCEGTGFHGAKCDKACPGLSNLRLRGPVPYECVVI